jgi:hypothetical protein
VAINAAASRRGHDDEIDRAVVAHHQDLLGWLAHGHTRLPGTAIQSSVISAL